MLYLLFNEGWVRQFRPKCKIKEPMREAIRLTRPGCSFVSGMGELMGLLSPVPVSSIPAARHAWIK